MLRHTCGLLVADAGHDTRRLRLWGTRDIKHTTPRDIWSQPHTLAAARFAAMRPTHASFSFLD
jgi:hypothetical protein